MKISRDSELLFSNVFHGGRANRENSLNSCVRQEAENIYKDKGSFFSFSFFLDHYLLFFCKSQQEHSKDCHGQFNWLHPKILTRVGNFCNRKVNEALETQCHKAGPQEEFRINREESLGGPSSVHERKMYVYFWTDLKSCN